MLTRIAYPIAVIVALWTAAFGQSLPDEIRGYKVYQPKIKVENSAKSRSNDSSAAALVSIGHPKLVDIGLTGARLEIGLELAPTGHSGRIDFITFHDLRANGVSVEVEEYDHPFSFTKDERIKLPQPTRVFIRSAGIAKAAYNEYVESKSEWNVTGTVFVFGRFKKYGLSFKRVVPIRIDIKIANPLKPPAVAGN